MTYECNCITFRNEVKQIIAKKDKDFDGYLSFEEFTGKETRMEKAFRAFDVNNDGYISKQEFQQVCRDCSEETINFTNKVVSSFLGTTVVASIFYAYYPICPCNTTKT